LQPIRGCVQGTICLLENGQTLGRSGELPALDEISARGEDSDEEEADEEHESEGESAPLSRPPAH
jgi:hypothetical protein